MKQLVSITDDLTGAAAKLKLGCVPMIPYVEPGSKDLTEKARIFILKDPPSKVFLMKAHGVLILEQSVRAGLELAELTEGTAKIVLLAGDRLTIRRRCFKEDGFQVKSLFLHIRRYEQRFPLGLTTRQSWNNMIPEMEGLFKPVPHVYSRNHWEHAI